MNKIDKFRSFTGATIEDVLSSDLGPEDLLKKSKKRKENSKKSRQKYDNSLKGQKAEKRYRSSSKGQETYLNYHLKRNYNIDIAHYNNLLKKQDGRCAICFDLPTNRRLAVDHNHTTGKVRGLLCSKCNFAIGLLCESKELFERALKYLER